MSVVNYSCRRFYARIPWTTMLTLVWFFLPLVVGGQQNLDEPFGAQKDLWGLAGAIFRLGIVLLIIAAAIFIALGAYMYFTAAGNAESAKTGKDYVTRAIMGLILGLLAWIILNTISPQFVGK